MLNLKIFFISFFVMVFSILLASYFEKNEQNFSKKLCLIASLLVGIYYILAGLYLAIDWTNSKTWNEINNYIRYVVGTIFQSNEGIMIYLLFPYEIIVLGGFITYLSLKVLCGKGKVSNQN